MRNDFGALPTPVTTLNRTVGPDRTFALIRADLDTVRDIAHAHDAKINDVLLAATAAGLKALLLKRGEPVDAMPVYVPVTLRPQRTVAPGGATGNRIGQMIVPLPLATDDPGRRLREIAAATARAKAKPHPSLGLVLRNRIVRRALLKILDRHPVSVTTADLPGPRQPIHLAGARVLEVFPILPLIGKVPIGVGALSYVDQFALGLVADPVACPDFQVFVSGARSELEALAQMPARTR